MSSDKSPNRIIFISYFSTPLSVYHTGPWCGINRLHDGNEVVHFHDNITTSSRNRLLAAVRDVCRWSKNWHVTPGASGWRMSYHERHAAWED
jgi:hypothetical protein